MKRFTLVLTIILALLTAMAFVGCDNSSEYTVAECKEFAKKDFKEHWQGTADYYTFVNSGSRSSEIRITSCEFLSSESTSSICVFKVTGRTLCNKDVYAFGSYISYDYKTGKQIEIKNDDYANVSKGHKLDKCYEQGYK